MVNIETFLICEANRPSIMATRYSNPPPRVLPADDDAPWVPEPSPMASAQARRAHRYDDGVARTAAEGRHG